MKKSRFFLLIFTLFTLSSSASHVRGGEITWVCLGSGTNMGKLVFTMKLYANCGSGAASMPASATISNPLYNTYGGPASIALSRTSQFDLSPDCSGGNSIYCGATGADGARAYQENIYVSSPIQLNGIPSVTGSVFGYSIAGSPSCQNTNNSGIYIRSVMYAYTDVSTGITLSLGDSVSGPSCYDNSPVHAEKAYYLHTRNKVNYFTAKSIDIDCDSLYYQRTVPLYNATSTITYSAGYSMIYPFGTSTSNMPHTIDGHTGDMRHMTQNSLGNHRFAHKVTSYKNRQKVAEVYRDFIVIVDSMTSNTYDQGNAPPSITFKNYSAPAYSTVYNDTFNVGDTVKISIRAVDNNFLNASTMQTASLRLIPDPALEQPFNPWGCQYMNCATLDTSSIYWNGSSFSATGVAFADFSWKLDCEHIFKCGGHLDPGQVSTYTFSVVAWDNMCDKPLRNIQSFTITVKDNFPDLQGKITSIDIRDTLTDITWTRYQGGSFRSYLIYRADSLGEPFVLIDSTTSVTDTFYTDYYPLASKRHEVYKVIGEVDASCNGFEYYAPNIILEIDTNNMIRELTWNRMEYGDFYNSFQLYGYYLVEYNNGNGWLRADSISHSYWPKYKSWTDSIAKCMPGAKFRIRAFDQLNNISYLSNEVSLWSYDTLVTVYPEICDGDSMLIDGVYRKQTGTYYQQVQNLIGCTITEKNELTVNPTYNLSAGPVNICRGDRVMLGGDWRTESGTYQDAYQTDKGCDSLINTVLVVTQVDTSVSKIGNSTLKANLGGATYQWIKCSNKNQIIGATSQSFSPLKNGSFQVVITDGPCTDTSSCFTLDYVGVEDLSQARFSVYPNPAREVLFLEWNGVEEVTFSLFDSRGKQVATDKVVSNKQISLQEVADGLYFYTISKDAQILAQGKLMVKR